MGKVTCKKHGMTGECYPDVKFNMTFVNRTCLTYIKRMGLHVKPM